MNINLGINVKARVLISPWTYTTPPKNHNTDGCPVELQHLRGNTESMSRAKDAGISLLMDTKYKLNGMKS